MDTPADPTTDPAAAPTDGTDAPPAPPEGTPDSPETPPWGDDFDAARAWKTIQSLREVEKEHKAAKAEAERVAREKADAEKTEIEKEREARLAAETALADLQRERLVARIAKEHDLDLDAKDDDGISVGDFLTAQDEEGLKKQAAALKRLAGSPAPTSPIPGKPRPALVPGSAHDDGPDPMDPAAVAARIRANL